MACHAAHAWPKSKLLGAMKGPQFCRVTFHNYFWSGRHY